MRSICGPKAPSTTEMMPLMKFAASVMLYAFLKLSGVFYITTVAAAPYGHDVQGHVYARDIPGGRGTRCTICVRCRVRSASVRHVVRCLVKVAWGKRW